MKKQGIKANTAQKVWSILEGDIAVKRCLSRGLINTRALARHIIERHEPGAIMDSVISAIRRLSEAGEMKKSEDKISSMFKDSIIKTRNNVVCLTVKLDALNHLKELGLDDTRLITGSREFKIIVDRNRLEEYLSVFGNSVVKMEEGLSELSVVLNERVVKTSGIAARVTNEIAMHDINIEEILVCPPEFLICVKEADVIKTHEALLKLANEG